VTDVRLTAASAAGPNVDALVIGIGADPHDGSKIDIPASGELRPATRRRILQALERLGAKGTAEEVTRLPGIEGLSAPLVIAVGIGTSTELFTPEQLRRAAGAATLSLTRSKRVGIIMPATTPASIAAIAQGALLGSYRFTAFKGIGTTEVATAIKSITVVTDLNRDRHAREALKRAVIVANEVMLARDLVNTPPSALHPQELAVAAVQAVAELGVSTEVLTEIELLAGHYGGIIGVGQGSANPPRLVRLQYSPARSKIHVALVGKGITFDSGGLSIKTGPGMITMKSDMGGAAAVIAATAAIARLGIPATITTYAACAENMPSGTAQRPGDVITTYSGKTVEVLNTDAEGRLVLADALSRAAQDEPDVIIDVATLTGAQTVALGTRVSAVMSNSDELRDDVIRAAEISGEQFWPMPLPKELRASLDSPIADLANIGERLGGMLTAGLFLQEFIEHDTPWAHLDIAGPAFNEGKAHDYTPLGGTGVAVRTLVQLVRDLTDASTK